MSTLARVVVTRSIIGVCFMQVCAAKDATDEEVLAVANRENPAGTMNGWSRVYRADDEFCGEPSKYAPVPCSDDPNRLHLMLAC